MNNFEKWKSGLTLENIIVDGLYVPITCRYCPVYKSCNVLKARNKSITCKDEFTKWATAESEV